MHGIATAGVAPVHHLLAAAGVLSTLPAQAQQILTGREFFPADLSAVPPRPGVEFAVAAGLAALAGGSVAAAARRPLPAG